MFPVRRDDARPRLIRRFARILIIAQALLAVAFIYLVRPPGESLEMTSARLLPTADAIPEPNSLLGRVLEAHGGIVRWSEVEKMRARLRFGGMAFRMRQIEPEPTERWVEIDVRVPHSVFEDYPAPGLRGIFTSDKVWIESADGQILKSLDNPRSVLLQSRRRQLWWDDLDLLYFAGYAIWNYLQGPFLLVRAGVEVRELSPWDENGETWQRLAARFHGSVPTHSTEQVFYFGPDLLQRRQDYQADVFASWARAAHYSSRYREFEGLQFPTIRRVVPRGADGRAINGPLLVWIELLELRALPGRVLSGRDAD